MQLALRKTAPNDASLWQRFACWAIKARLASQYCHGGIVIDGRLYHATSARGLHSLEAHEWTPERWWLIDLGDGRDDDAFGLFEKHVGAEYDWVSLLAFVGIPARDVKRFYSFEWCLAAMTGEVPTDRVTAEKLLSIILIEKRYFADESNKYPLVY